MKTCAKCKDSKSLVNAHQTEMDTIIIAGLVKELHRKLTGIRTETRLTSLQVILERDYLGMLGYFVEQDHLLQLGI